MKTLFFTDYIRMKPHHIPNILTAFRFLLVVPILFSILDERFTLALGIFIIASVTDAFDGLLARIYGWTSPFGAIVDPLADKALLMTSFIALGWVGQIPEWLVILVVARDIWIVLGALSYRYFIGEIKFAPTGISKVNTFLQILLVTMLLVDLGLFSLPRTLLYSTIIAVLITTLITLVHYTISWTLLAIKNYRLRNKREQKNNPLQNLRGSA